MQGGSGIEDITEYGGWDAFSTEMHIRATTRARGT